jgi:hypothetical protein
VILRKRKERRKKEHKQTQTQTKQKQKQEEKSKRTKGQRDKGTKGHRDKRNKGRKANKRSRDKTYLPDFPVPLLAHNFQKERNESPEGVDGEEGTAKEVAEDAKPGD